MPLFCPKCEPHLSSRKQHCPSHVAPFSLIFLKSSKLLAWLFPVALGCPSCLFSWALHFNPMLLVLSASLSKLSMWGVTPGLCLRRCDLHSLSYRSCHPAAPVLSCLGQLSPAPPTSCPPYSRTEHRPCSRGGICPSTA